MYRNFLSLMCVISLLITLSVSLQASPSDAVLLVPAETGRQQTNILAGKLEAVFGAGSVRVNPASLEGIGSSTLVAGFGDSPLLKKIAESNKLHLGDFDLNGNGYLFREKCMLTGASLAAAHDFLGLYYAIDEIRSHTARLGRWDATDRLERPALRFRGITSHDNWNAAFMDSVLTYTLRHRLNRIELKETDLDDFIFYEKFDKLNAFRNEDDTVDPVWGDASLRSRKMIENNRRWLKDYVRKCHAYGIEVVMWHHEFVILDELCAAYPEMCANDSLLYSSGLFFQWLESKYDEFFQGPGAEIDGIVLTTVEGNVHLIDFGEELILRTLEMARTKCNQYGKKLIFRTFGWDDPQETALANVANRLPDDIWMMHKHIPMDWCDAFPHNPNLQRVRGKKSLLETELAGEQRGRSALPVWVGDYFKYRLKNAMPTGILGATGRITHGNGLHMHDPVYGGSFNPCTCNLFTFSRLLWNPEADVEELYMEWAREHYGSRVAAHVVGAFRPMQRAMMKMMLGRGQFLNLRFVMNYDQWREVMHWGNNLSDFDHSHPVQFRLRQLEKPDSRFFDEFLPEKDEAVGMVTKALGEIRLTRGMMPEREYVALEAFFERMLNLAVFCRYQMEAFGWLKHVDGITAESKERLKICHGEMTHCATKVERWNPDYRNEEPFPSFSNTELWANMQRCIDDIEQALGN